jgi:hypothetical protein
MVYSSRDRAVLAPHFPVMPVIDSKAPRIKLSRVLAKEFYSRRARTQIVNWEDLHSIVARNPVIRVQSASQVVDMHRSDRITRPGENPMRSQGYK